MQLERSDAFLDLSDPNIIVGPRKRQPTERLLENGDPLACKKVKKYTKDLENMEKHTPLSMPQPTPVADAMPAGQARQTMHSAKSTVDRARNEAEAIVVEDTDEENHSANKGGIQNDDVDEGETTDEDDDSELVRLQKEWDAPVYVFFKPFPTIQYIKDRKAHVFICAASPCLGQTRFVRRFLDTSDAKSTSNLRRHAKMCWSKEAVRAADGTRDVRAAQAALRTVTPNNGSITAAFQRLGKGKVVYSHRQHTKIEACAEIVRWVTESSRPFQIVNDRGFRSLMKTGRPDYHIPSVETVSHDVKNVFVRARGRFAKALQEYDGKLSFGTDSWSSPNHKSYMAITVHLERSGQPFSMLLDLVEVAVLHTGVNLGIAFMTVLKTFGIDKKILGITGDNASNNDGMIKYLGNALEEFPGPANQTQCFVHTVNLIARAILKPFEEPKKKKDVQAFNEAAQALSNLAEGLQAVDDGLDQQPENEEGRHGDDDNDIDKNDETIDDGLNARLEPIRAVLQKLRKFSFALKNSTTILLPAWDKLLSTHGLPPCMMPWDVSTCWNSTFDMLKFAICYRVAIDAMTAVREYDLRKYEMGSAEWNIAKELREVLKIFKDATLFFSCDTPNLATVLPAMALINDFLTTTSDLSSKFCLAIHAALTIGKKTLDKYHNKTGESDVYRIAMVLHPQYKLEFFKKQNWDALSIEEARDVVQDEFDRTYWLLDVEGDDCTSQSDGDIAVSKFSESSNIFDGIMNAAPPPSSLDELQRYLIADVEDVTDALMWWHERRKVFPRLSRMACDYLSIPATTVDVERVFSHGRLLLPHVRSRLAVESTRASLCVGLWSSQGLIKDHDIKGALSADEIAEEEEELAMGWDAIHTDAL